MTLSRRTLLATGAALAAVPAAAVPATSLDGIARGAGLRFGTCLGLRGLADPAYRTLVARECGLITPENELKWQATRPAPDRFDFLAADRLVGWATAHGIGVRGHTLLWHRQERFPAWLVTHDFGTRPAAAAARLVEEHVRTVAGRYAATIRSFDVVNETVDPATGRLRETVLSRAMGGTEPLIDLAFHVARAAVPAAELVYNDYMSWEPGFEAHRAGVLRLLEGFRRRGTPVDALGIQSHIGAGPEDRDAPFGGSQGRAWRQFLDAVTAMGYRLLVTEFDVDDRALPPAIGPRDQAVAAYAADYCAAMLAYPGLGSFVAWGLADRLSWLQEFRPRADGRPKRPNPYDDALRPKPLRDALATAFRTAPQREAA